jgi:hypothetical protein
MYWNLARERRDDFDLGLSNNSLHHMVAMREPADILW